MRLEILDDVEAGQSGVVERDAIGACRCLRRCRVGARPINEFVGDAIEKAPLSENLFIILRTTTA